MYYTSFYQLLFVQRISMFRAIVLELEIEKLYPATTQNGMTK